MKNILLIAAITILGMGSCKKDQAIEDNCNCGKIEVFEPFYNGNEYVYYYDIRMNCNNQLKKYQTYQTGVDEIGSDVGLEVCDFSVLQER